MPTPPRDGRRCVELLMGTASGRQLLLAGEGSSGIGSSMARLLPALRWRSAAAAEAAQGAEGVVGWQAVKQALDAALLWMRAALHAACDARGEEAAAPLGVAQAAAMSGAMQGGAAAMAAAAAALQAAADASDERGAAGVAEGVQGLLSVAQQWLGLLGDALQLFSLPQLIGGRQQGAQPLAISGHQGVRLLAAAAQVWQEEEGEDLPAGLATGVCVCWGGGCCSAAVLYRLPSEGWLWARLRCPA